MSTTRRDFLATAVGSRYYHHWLAALERLVIEKGLTDRAGLDVRSEAWIEGYQHTPHGQPVELLADHIGDTNSCAGTAARTLAGIDT
jgi:hypothetical protein